ncbi:hypothetical protein [Nocardia ninae]|uniref:Uncharacterized protein n=1 Tax=Nocardia ninae NBRC 108245 TaxID=1210091 RepID=A0A511MQC2_9NOCA|nr:hypothetical protein [Nocardia ninae]GEM42176.1 hypothetical protein NN4_66950 [Nocardia ninae NBRC 108245]
MGKRYVNRDPVMTRATDTVDGIRFNELFRRVLETLGPDDASFVRRVASGESMVQIALDDGIPPRAVQRRMDKLMSRLRHPSRSQYFGDYLDDDFQGMWARNSTWSEPGEGRWCDRHERWGASLPASQLTCEVCPCELPVGLFGESLFGRPRVYCSDACKQFAYRLRKKKEVSPSTS